MTIIHDCITVHKTNSPFWCITSSYPKCKPTIEYIHIVLKYFPKGPEGPHIGKESQTTEILLVRCNVLAFTIINTLTRIHHRSCIGQTENKKKSYVSSKQILKVDTMADGEVGLALTVSLLVKRHKQKRTGYRSKMNTVSMRSGQKTNCSIAITP